MFPHPFCPVETAKNPPGGRPKHRVALNQSHENSLGPTKPTGGASLTSRGGGEKSGKNVSVVPGVGPGGVEGLPVHCPLVLHLHVVALPPPETLDSCGPKEGENAR